MVLSPAALASSGSLWPLLSSSFSPRTGKAASHKTDVTLIGKGLFFWRPQNVQCGWGGKACPCTMTFAKMNASMGWGKACHLKRHVFHLTCLVFLLIPLITTTHQSVTCNHLVSSLQYKGLWPTSSYPIKTVLKSNVKTKISVNSPRFSSLHF